jgi:hypothetical protein
MSNDYIEAISSDQKPRKANSFDRWQKYLDRMEEELANSDNDPFESATYKKMLIMCHHVQSGEAKLTSQQIRDFIKNVRIKDLTNSHKPGFKEIAPTATLIISGLAIATLGIVPIVGGLSQAASGICSSISSGVNAVGVTGSQSLSGVFSGQKQAALAGENYELQASNQAHDDIIQSRREAEEARKRQAEEAKQLDMAAHQAKQAVLAN